MYVYIRLYRTYRMYVYIACICIVYTPEMARSCIQIIDKNNDRTIHSFNQQNFPMCFIVVHCCNCTVKKETCIHSSTL